MGFGWFCLPVAYFNGVSYSWCFNWEVYSVEWEIRAEQGLSGFFHSRVLSSTAAMSRCCVITSLYVARIMSLLFSCLVP